MKKAIDYLIFANAALTVVMTLLVIYTIWFPHEFIGDFGWKVVGSYLVIIINMIVLFKVKDIYAVKETHTPSKEQA